jgi:hypothetical protein
MGMAMAGQMMNQSQWAQNNTPSAASPPPPPPIDKVWHIAVDGQTNGPFSRAELGRMAASGELTRVSLVWTAGLDGWKTATELTELAQLFTVSPPPPPSS